MRASRTESRKRKVGTSDVSRLETEMEGLARFFS